MINAQETLARQIIKALGFHPQDGSSSTWVKSYANHNNYKIKVVIDAQKIDYGSKITLGDKTTCNFKAQENFVVLECVNRLLEKGYKPKNITLEKIYPSGHGHSGKLDICVSHDDGSEYLLIECKTWGKEFEKESAKMEKDGGQLFTYFKFSNKADIIMLYASELNKKNIIYKHKVIKIEGDYRVGDVKDFYDKWNKLTKDNGVFDDWVTPYHFISRALTPQLLEAIRQEDSGFIFNRFLEILRHNVVSDKPNAFNKIFTLFLCKIYDEKTTKKDEELKFQWLEGIDNDVSFQTRLADLYKKGMSEFLDKEVTDFSDADFDNKYNNLDAKVKEELRKDIIKLRLEKNNEFAIKEVFDEKSFKENAKVVKQVVELLQGFKIRYAKKQQYLSDFFELLLTTGLKQESGQFFTPVPIAQFIIKSIPTDKLIEEKLAAGEKNNLLPYVMDYAAGSGHFLTEMMHEVQRTIDKKDPSKYIADTAKKIKNWKEDHFDWALQYVYGIEKDYRLVKVGKVGCYLHGDGLANVIHSDGLGNFKNTEEYKGKLKENDTDFPRENKQFDMVISNPPYSVQAFKQNARNYYTDNDFELYSSLTDNSSEIECLFIERTKQLLKDGGMAGIILPSSILSNTGIYTKAREIILQNFDIVAIAELGSNTFMATGTNTVTLFLRRKNNYDSINLKKSVASFFTNLQEVTLNKIEKPISKYVAHTWENISFYDYKTLLQKQPNEAMQKHELYQEYQSKITAKTETEKWNAILKIEEEKLLYFIMAYPQKIVLVNSGEKKAEKQFLGYEFSNRRGSEGIHPIQRGKNIDECTKLFDADIHDNPEKASTYIYKAFQGDFDFKIDESLRKNVCHSNLVDMLTFDCVDFEKTISLSAKKKIRIESKWKLKHIGEIIFEQQKSKIKVGDAKDSKNGSYRFFTSGEKVLKYDNYLVDKGNIFLSTGGNAIINYFNGKASYSTDTFVIKSIDDNEINTKFIFYFLESIIELINEFYFKGVGLKHLQKPDFRKIKIPVPPKEIQTKIIIEIENLEKKENSAIKKIEELENSIVSTFENLKFIESKLDKISIFKNGLNYSRQSAGDFINIVGVKDFKNNFSPDVDALNKIQINGKLSDDYNLLPNDILVVRSNGSANLVGRFLFINELNTLTSFSGFTIRIRPDPKKVNSKFLCHYLKTNTVRSRLTKDSKGANIKSLNQGLLSSIKIPLPSISEQQRIISQTEAIENKISVLQKELAEIPKQKDDVLKKYL
jgi:type I restriction enzyme M protein